MLDHAETCLEEVTGQPTDAFADLRGWLFDDFDHEYLFAPAYDGIDDADSYEGARLGVASLHPSAWFDAFAGANPVHPMVQ